MSDSQYLPFDEMALITIEVDGNTNVLCKAPAGSSITDNCWQICQQIRTQDANFSGYPYTRIKWAVVDGKAESRPVLKASDAMTFTFI